MTLRLAGVVEESVVDGPGLRFVVFAQGCKHKCKGCQNPHTWDFNGGYEESVENLITKIEENRLIRRVTFSGGDPFYQEEGFTELARELKARGYSVGAYTGFRIEEIWNSSMLSYLDFVVDGMFDISKRTLELRFRGSSNQRVIDVKKSLKEDRVVELNW